VNFTIIFHGRSWTDLKNRRQELALRSLSRVPPSSSEAEDLHSFHLRFGQEVHIHDEFERVWMEDTVIETAKLMFPQERKCVMAW